MMVKSIFRLFGQKKTEQAEAPVTQTQTAPMGRPGMSTREFFDRTMAQVDAVLENLRKRSYDYSCEWGEPEPYKLSNGTGFGKSLTGLMSMQTEQGERHLLVEVRTHEEVYGKPSISVARVCSTQKDIFCLIAHPDHVHHWKELGGHRHFEETLLGLSRVLNLVAEKKPSSPVFSPMNPLTGTQLKLS